MAAPEVADPAGHGADAIARLAATVTREDVLAVMREIVERDAFAGRLACSPDEGR